VTLQKPEVVNRMREACGLAREVLDLACASVEVGITTDEIDKIVHSALTSCGAYPSPLNYAGFPKSVCSSVNEVICHGIPDSRPLLDGDIVSFDVSCYLDGVHGDNCGTVAVGNVDEAGHTLIKATKEGMMAGIAAAQPGSCLTAVGAAIHEVADKYNFSSVRKYCGHGVADVFHAPPYVKHFRNSDECMLLPGMIFTIEPMFVEGNQASTTWSDNWTAVTVDGGRAAQFEHAIVITEEGNEILTL
ncbi:hypothetical protein TL16_g01130, partial [Triparma laevis f. inornata]